MSNLKHEETASQSSIDNVNPGELNSGGESESEWMRKLRRFILREDYSGAIKMLRETAQGPDARNALAVCLMRAGKVPESIEVLKSLVIEPGSLVERSDVPIHFRRNFATALLMCQRINGGIQLLRSAKNERNHMYIQLTKAVEEWEKSLSFWQKVNWKLYAIVPDNRPFRLTFVPGEFTAAS